MSKSIFLLLLIGLLSGGSLVLAEEDTDKVRPEDRINMPRPSVSPKDGIKVKAQEQKDQFRQDIKDIKTNVKTEIKDAKVQLKNTEKTMKEDIKKRKEEFNDTVKTKRAELQDQIKTKREELKVRLDKIKDEHKKKTVERIDQRIDALNDKMMRHFSSVLVKLEEMLVRISERADRVSIERGLDVSSVRSAIDKANTAIASARSAIEVQSGNIYTIKITTESALKIDVGKARQALNTDLAKVRDAVKAAHLTVKDAAVVLAQLAGKSKVSPSPLVSPIN